MEGKLKELGEALPDARALPLWLSYGEVREEYGPAEFASALLGSPVTGTDHSLSVGTVLTLSSSKSSTLLPPAPPLCEPEPDADARLRVDDEALVSRSLLFAFSSRS